MLEFLSEGKSSRPGRGLVYRIRTQYVIPDPGLVGREILLNRQRVTVISAWRGPGIRPPGIYMKGLEAADIAVKITPKSAGSMKAHVE